MSAVAVRLAISILTLGLLGCAHVDDVQATTIQPRYLRPTPKTRAARPLVLIYNPTELPDVVELAVPSGFPHASLRGARSLVTEHLRSGLESLFEHVSVVDDPAKLPTDATVGTVHFVEIGLALAPGGNTLVGTLEWSLTLTSPGDPRPLYTWGERTVGTREGAGAFGHLDPQPEVQGAIEASLRTMLKDMDAKGITSSEPQ